ncbi:MAG TPA: anti-sigma factor [Burkholderiales bacterium]|nr:anti-sigma factor [Burkholderiales bacterium]
MRYDSDELREKLAAEYVLGTLAPRARRRFRTLLRQDPRLRRAVADWEQRLSPLAEAVPQIAPPARVWRAIRARIRPPRLGPRQSLSFWRAAALGSALVAATLIVLLALPDRRPVSTPEMMVAVMNDVQTRAPAMTVSWTPGGADRRVLRIRVMGHAEMAPDTAWELWLLPGGNRPPVSIGLISTHETQTLVVPAAQAALLDAAWGLAMSVEPKGGSPTGRPTGPVLYSGPCVKT